MKYLLLAMLALSTLACVEKKPLTVAIVTPTEYTIEMFCREDADQLAQVNALRDKGFSYVGVLNGNGINCNHVLFSKK